MFCESSAALHARMYRVTHNLVGAREHGITNSLPSFRCPVTEAVKVTHSMAGRRIPPPAAHWHELTGTNALTRNSPVAWAAEIQDKGLSALFTLALLHPPSQVFGV